MLIFPKVRLKANTLIQNTLPVVCLILLSLALLCFIHMSRHSFATSICLTNGVPIESLSQMMGHLSIKTTQIYAKVTRTKLNEDMSNLAQRIEGKYELAETVDETGLCQTITCDTTINR
ncbi:Tyrosine recombinase XerD [termite gut metagenome]|uniref:Tyrosine recombinase XerD n=1 Tax=termite gut metagenome TaxID=433724 RepID=A0A5J4QXN7_9ZZZZ